MNKTRKLTYITMLCALAIVINIIENSFIPELPLGIRFGLANIISLITINLFTNKDMVIVNIMRVLLGNLITGTIFGTRFFIALGGILLSSISLIITKKLNSSISFSSMVSSFFHTIGQIIVVCFIYNTAYMLTAIPIYIISSIGTGVLTGVIASSVIKRVKI